METKHFSHIHALLFHQIPQAYSSAHLHCAGCKIPVAAGTNIYACWQCRYYLHEQCFHTPRSLTHPAHPLHPLTLSPIPTYPSASFICNACHLTGNGFSYTCSQCDFDIHVACAHSSLSSLPQNHLHPNSPVPVYSPPPPNSTVPTYSTVLNPTITTVPPPRPPTSMIRHFSHPHVLKEMEVNKNSGKLCSACECELAGVAYCCTDSCCKFNLHKACFDAPTEIRHKSHLQHQLKLLSAPPYSDGFTCNACIKDGRAFAYTCEACSYDLHIDCVRWPDSVSRSDHPHPLTLYYSSPTAEAAAQDATFVCDVCSNPVHEMAWVYYCRECDFGTHLECVKAVIKAEGEGGDGGGSGGKTEEELVSETELKFALLQLLLGGQSGNNVVLELNKK